MIHQATFKIRTFHCDAFGHVNNSRHTELLEEARWQFAEAIGLLPMLKKTDVGFIIMDMRVRFRAPVFESETVQINTCLKTLGSASGEVEQLMYKADGSMAIKSLFHFILIDRNNNNASVAIDGDIRDLLIKVLEPTGAKLAQP